MKAFLIIAPVFLPIIAGVVLLVLRHRPSHRRNVVSFSCAIVNLIIVLAGAFFCEGYEIRLFGFLEGLELVMGYDSLGRLFAVLVSVLWPFSLLYAYEYMEHAEGRRTFYGFYLMSLGATVGIAYSTNLFTLYIFYELLTLVTFPLVMHTMSKEAMRAGLKYLCYMFGGAAFAFVGMIIVLNYGSCLDFIPGGVLSGVSASDRPMLLAIFVITFCGFSVKAAMMPFGKWLISAAVAPMPVTGLLHAVAVVKAGAFACIRLIYYVFGTELLAGTWAQYVPIILTSFTILYGSVMAVREQHFKRRLAYSTLSNLSYILVGALMMTPAGLTGALMHLVVHAVTKLALFFSAGAVIHMTERVWVYELDGMGRYMKRIWVFFTIAALSLIGIPPLGGFASKLRLIVASLDEGSAWGLVGGFAIIISALLTAVYLLTVVVRVYFPKDGIPADGVSEAKDPGWRMLVPIGFGTAATLLIGIFWEPLTVYIESISALM